MMAIPKSVFQSTRHIMMIEPAVFFANPETMDTNMYQVDQSRDEAQQIFAAAHTEFRAFRDLLVDNGVIVTTAKGYEGCPDMVFPNWASTHGGGRMVLYPMMNENRRAERAPEIIAALQKAYPNVIDLTARERTGKYLEARGSLVCDRVNKIAYAGLSARTDSALAVEWAEMMDYEIEIFETMSHTGQPVYHTDLVMWVGSSLAGVCLDCIRDADQERILHSLSRFHDVIEFSMAQLQQFCGNALEVRGAGNKPMLALSSTAYEALREDQKEIMLQHFDKLLHSPLPTLEKYGGGSARCTLMELY